MTKTEAQGLRALDERVATAAGDILNRLDELKGMWTNLRRGIEAALTEHDQVRRQEHQEVLTRLDATRGLVALNGHDLDEIHALIDRNGRDLLAVKDEIAALRASIEKGGA
jgi:transposase